MNSNLIEKNENILQFKVPKSYHNLLENNYYECITINMIRITMFPR